MQNCAQENYIIYNNKLRVEISTKGAELQKILYKGEDRLYDGSLPIWEDKAPVLFPVAGRLWDNTFINNGIKYFMDAHGFAPKKIFEIYKKSSKSITLLLKSDEQTLDAYPFKFEFFITYTVKGKKLLITKKIVNVDNKTIYFSTGTHDGILCDNDKNNLSISFSKKENLNSCLLYPNTEFLTEETKNLGKNTDLLKLDNSHFINSNTLIFKQINSRCITLNKDGKPYVKFRFGYENLLVWSEIGAPFICLEFWNNLPDVYQKPTDFSNKYGVIQLAKGKSKKICHSLQLF